MSNFNIESDKLTGKYRAVVVDVNDELMRGRVLVKCESLMPDKPELGWAESCFMPGEFNLPRKGDSVWIEFENGDITLPIWVGIMPTREYVKTYLFEEYGDRTNYDPKIHIMRSEKHQGIHLMDGAKNGETQILMKDKAGSTLQLESESTDIIIKSTGNIQENPHKG